MTSFVIAGKHVVHQNIADEIIIVDLNTGNYLSLTGSAVNIWELIVKGLNREQIVIQLAATFDGTVSDISASVGQVLEQLLSNQLIVPGDDNTPAVTPEVTLCTTSGAKPPFPKAELFVYDDMQDALLLDPIHDFDDAGWPTVPAPAPASVPAPAAPASVK